MDEPLATCPQIKKTFKGTDTLESLPNPPLSQYAGLPDLGRSTLFNVLAKNYVLVASYPFVTIKPNVSVVNFPESELDTQIIHSPATTSYWCGSRLWTLPVSGRIGIWKKRRITKFITNTREVDTRI
jgi:hypothetical protein